MCGRIAITLPHDAAASLFGAIPAQGLPPVPRYNVCPSQPLAAVVSSGGARHLGPMRWGLVPRWYRHPGDGPLLFNARAETLADKPAFAESARRRRCLIAVTGFYEWTVQEGSRLPWFVTRSDRAPMVLAGVWSVWKGADGARVAGCAVVTCAATGTMADLHARVPVVVDPENWPLWLGEEGHGAARLMRPLPEGALTACRVGVAINSNRAEGAALIAPLEAG